MRRSLVSAAEHLVLAVTVLALVSSIARVEAGSSSPDRIFIVGVDEDWLKWGRTRSTVAVASTLGLRAVRITMPWRSGQSRLSSADRRTLDAATVGARSLRLVVAVYGDADEAPVSESERDAYCSYATDLVRTYPWVRDIVIWNEPNNPRFWQPQFEADGTSAAPAAYEALLARCWTLLHSARANVNVIAASAPRGNDAPWKRDASHSPGAWYRLLGAAYRASGRGERIFDTVGHNPYPNFTSERPWVRHRTSGAIAQGDYAKLTDALEDAFGESGQPVPGESRVSIWYMEQGFQTTIDRGKEQFYSGWETDRFALRAWSRKAGNKLGSAPDQSTQLVDSIRLAYCQPTVGAYFNFLLVDEPDLRGWQSGVFWADWTPKPSYSAFKQAIRDIAEGTIECRELTQASRLPAAPETSAPLEISDAHVSSLSPLEATISWRTSLPTDSTLAYGLPGSSPTLWESVTGLRTEHRVALSGLSLTTSYRVWLRAVGPDGQQAEATLDLTTPALANTVRASAPPRMGVLVDGEPFFPLMVWSQCPGDYERSLAAGINLFAENPCGDLQEQLVALAGRALSAGVSGREGGSGLGLIGFFHPDEADGRGLDAASLPDPPPGADQGLSFLTLTNHFYSGADPLAWGRAMYRGLIAASDVVGFDLYPLQEWCRPWTLPQVYDAQQELVRLAKGKPTFQWIEAAEWRCPGGSTAVTPATVRAEAWLAIAGGARGLGFFPAAWSAEVAEAIGGISRDVAKLGPALFSFPAGSAVIPRHSPVRIGVRSHSDALYVVAVNSSRERTGATMRVPDLGGRPVTVLDEGRTIIAQGDSFSDSFEPLAVHIYVVPPPGA